MKGGRKEEEDRSVWRRGRRGGEGWEEGVFGQVESFRWGLVRRGLGTRTEDGMANCEESCDRGEGDWL